MNSEHEFFQIVLAKVLIFEVPLSQTSFKLYFFCCTFCCTVCFTVKLVPCYWLFTTLARESLDRHSVFFHFYSWLLNILHNAFGLQCAPFVPVWFSHYYFHGANFFFNIWNAIGRNWYSFLWRGATGLRAQRGLYFPRKHGQISFKAWRKLELNENKMTGFKTVLSKGKT